MPLDTANRWLTFAENDYTVAKHLFEDFYPVQYEIICYHCQQTAEKAIKAVYIALSLPGGIPKKHDLSFLLSQMKNLVPDTDKLMECADELTPYGVTVRYPSEMTVDEHDTRCALNHANTILNWAKSAMASLANS